MFIIILLYISLLILVINSFRILLNTQINLINIGPIFSACLGDNNVGFRRHIISLNLYITTNIN
jgi:hypothetical protein